MRRQRRRAYTLMEVLLVMAVMVMFAALGYPALDSLYTGTKVESASDAVRAAWAEAQAHAMSEGRAYRFAVVPGKGNYRYAPDSADYWSGNTPENDPENPAVVVQKSLPYGMVFTSNGGPVPDPKPENSLPDEDVPSNMWTTAAIFLPDGSAQDDADITLRLPGARPITVHLRGLTGVVTTERGEQE